MQELKALPCFCCGEWPQLRKYKFGNMGRSLYTLECSCNKGKEVLYTNKVDMFNEWNLNFLLRIDLKHERKLIRRTMNMEIKANDVVAFLVNHGESYDLNYKTIEQVGIDRVCADISRQMVAKTAHMKGVNAHLEEHINAEEALHDYFGDGAFGNLYDKLWREGAIKE